MNVVWPYMASKEIPGKIPYNVYMFVIFLSMISRATIFLIFFFFLFPHCPRLTPYLKTEDGFK